MKCLGCGGDIPWDGKTAFAYTCRCGATIFTDDEKLYPPASLAFLGVRPPAHIDYYLGKSDHQSPKKEEMVKYLHGLGSVWSWDCPQCRDRFVERTAMEMANGFYRLPLHPELAKLLEGSVHGS